MKQAFDIELYTKSGWGQVDLCRALDTQSLLAKPTAVDGTVPRLFYRVPANNSLQVRAERAHLGHLPTLIPEDGDRLGRLGVQHAAASGREVFDILDIAL